MKVSRGR